MRLFRAIPSQNMMVIALAVIVPLCCCRVRVLAFHEHPVIGVAEHAAAASTMPECCARRALEHSDQHDPIRKPKQPDRERSDCCTKLIGVLDAVDTLPEAGVTGLASPLQIRVEAPSRVDLSAASRATRLHDPPTLLRLHCALII